MKKVIFFFILLVAVKVKSQPQQGGGPFPTPTLSQAVPNTPNSLVSWDYVQDLFTITGAAGADNHKLVTPTIVRNTNGVMAIYYGSYTSAGTGKLFAAYGNFVSGFTPYTNVLSPTPNTFDQGHVGGGRPYFENGTNFMFYFGGTNLEEVAPEFIGLAWTTDGTNFTKYGSNPILVTNAANPTLDSGTLYSMCVIKEGANYFGYYNATAKSPVVSPAFERVFLATSTALTGPWTRLGPIFTNDPSITSDFSPFKITYGLWGAMYWVWGSGVLNAKVAYSLDLTNWSSSGYVLTNSSGNSRLITTTGPYVFYYNGLSALSGFNDATCQLFKKNTQQDAFSASSLAYSWWPGHDTSDNYWLGAFQRGPSSAFDSLLFNATSNRWVLQSPLNLPGVAISAGTVSLLTNVVYTNVTINPALATAASFSDTAITTVNGNTINGFVIKSNDVVTAVVPAISQTNGMYYAWISNTTIFLRYVNIQATSVDPAQGIFNVELKQYK